MRSDQLKPILVVEDNADESFSLNREALSGGGIKGGPGADKINRDDGAWPPSSSAKNVLQIHMNP